VTVRERAMFCPQCGNPIAQASPAMVADSSFDPTPTEAVKTDVAATQPLNAVIQPRPQNAPAEDGVRARVEKFRRVSSVVIDQAAYDPSLRFLLVAAALFVLFVVLLILSKVIG